MKISTGAPDQDTAVADYLASPINASLSVQGHLLQHQGLQPAHFGEIASAYVILVRLAVRVIGCDGSGSMLDVVSALEWVHTHVQMPAVVLMSLGGSVATVLDAAAQSLTDIGVTVVVAGGNAASGECSTSPYLWALSSIHSSCKVKDSVRCSRNSMGDVQPASKVSCTFLYHELGGHQMQNAIECGVAWNASIL